MPHLFSNVSMYSFFLRLLSCAEICITGRNKEICKFSTKFTCNQSTRQDKHVHPIVKKKKLYLIFYLASNFFQGSFFDLPKKRKAGLQVYSLEHTPCCGQNPFPFITLLHLVKQRSDKNKCYCLVTLSSLTTRISKQEDLNGSH